jgi:hypothetical protein
MRKDESERWPEDVDFDRVRASPRGIAAGWIVVAIFAGLMSIGPATVSSVDVVLRDVKQDVVKVEHRLAQSLAIFDCDRSS